MTPSSGFINLLEWLTECRETFYSLDYQFIVKGYNPGTARLKRCHRRVYREAYEVKHSPSVSTC